MSQNKNNVNVQELVNEWDELYRKASAFEKNNDVKDVDYADVKQKMREWEDKGYLDPINWDKDDWEMQKNKIATFKEYINLCYRKCEKNE